MADSSSGKVAIIVTIITVIGGIVTAVIANWEKLSSSGQDDQPPNQNSFRIVEATLRADPFDYRGPCPVTIEFSGRISTAGGAGVVAYKFLRSDGASAPVETFNVSAPGSKDVTTTWRLGAATPHFTPYEGWQAIQIIDPAEQESNRASFKIYCE